MGFVTLDVAIDDPNFGKSFPCPKCKAPALAAQRKAAANAKLADLIAASQIPRRFQTVSFESFWAMPDYLREGKEDAAQFCTAFSQTGYVVVTGIEYQGIVLHGIFGGGKTGLATSALQPHITEGVMWTNFARLLARVQATYSGKGEVRGQDILDHVTSVKWLLLDDMGDVLKAEKVGHADRVETDDRRRIALEIVDRRHAEMLPTIITTNLDGSQFVEQFGERIAQKVYELCAWIEVGGANLRFER